MKHYQFSTMFGSLFYGLALVSATATAQESKVQFDDPVILQAGDKAMNKDGGMMYPSPAIFDIDRDGQNELVIGTIFGGVFASENENTESGDPVWSEPQPVKTVDGKPLKLNNW